MLILLNSFVKDQMLRSVSYISGGIIMRRFSLGGVGLNKFKILDRTIIHTKNSLGFRAEEPPKDFKSYLSNLSYSFTLTPESWWLEMKS